MSRKMVKWAPFASLKEQAIYLQAIKESRKKIDKPQISVDDEERINYFLQSYHGQTVILTYYHDGYVNILTSTIKHIDSHEQKILTSTVSISFNNLLDVTDV